MTVTPEAIYQKEIKNIVQFGSIPKKKPTSFIDFWNSLPSIYEIEFLNKYMDRRDYSFSPVVNEPIPHKLFKFRDNHGRKAIGVKTVSGNVILYQGHPGHCDQVHGNFPATVRALYGEKVTGWIDQPLQAILLGYDDQPNIGTLLDRIHTCY